ncbi:MAG: hypothetical protein ABI977_32445, partial [Acidobacteriota bacterium]
FRWFRDAPPPANVRCASGAKPKDVGKGKVPNLPCTAGHTQVQTAIAEVRPRKDAKTQCGRRWRSWEKADLPIAFMLHLGDFAALRESFRCLFRLTFQFVSLTYRSDSKRACRNLTLGYNAPADPHLQMHQASLKPKKRTDKKRRNRRRKFLAKG